MARRLLAAALIALLLSAAYTRWWNPEVRLYVHAARVKQEWASRLDREFTNKTVVFGGSSTSFSIDPGRLLERQGEAVANFGLHAGMQLRFLTAFAAAAARPGDLLLMAVEPELLVASSDGSDLAAQMGFALGQPGWIHASNVTGDPVRRVENLVSLRPGAHHFFTLLAKIALGKPLYRYAPADFTATGWQRTGERRAVTDPARWQAPLDRDARLFLAALKAWGESRGVRVAYALPWRYASAEAAPAFQTDNLRFLAEVAVHLPVLADERLGAYDVREHFADTPLHLTPEGAAVRSDALAEQLRAGRFWSRSVLERMLADRTRP